MNTKEKVKAYDEMVQRVKELHEAGNALTKKQMEIVLPELAESEDERIRKEIIEFINWANSRGSVRNDWLQKKRPAKWISYLEKQKEQKPVYAEIDNSKENVVFPFYARVKTSGKSVTIIDGQLSMDGLQWIKFCSDSYDHFNVYNPEDLVTEQEPAEWSEEDEQRIAEIEFAVMQMNTKRVDTKDKCLAWLKSLRPQPQTKTNDYITPHKKFFQWIYNRLVDVHGENPNVDYMQSFKKRIDNLQFDEPHWKPSEEQLITLLNAANGCYINGTQKQVLMELYNDLQKLM